MSITKKSYYGFKNCKELKFNIHANYTALLVELLPYSYNWMPFKLAKICTSYFQSIHMNEIHINTTVYVIVDSHCIMISKEVMIFSL